MSHRNEIDTFRAAWNAEAESTIRVLEALPNDQYDFRPDPKAAPSESWRGISAKLTPA